MQGNSNFDNLVSIIQTVGASITAAVERQTCRNWRDMAWKLGMFQRRAFEVILGDRFGSKPPLSERTSVTRRPSSTTMLCITTRHTRFDHLILYNIWRWCTRGEPSVPGHMSEKFGQAFQQGNHTMISLCVRIFFVTLYTMLLTSFNKLQMRNFQINGSN
jgi:hypothetical protein